MGCRRAAMIVFLSAVAFLSQASHSGTAAEPARPRVKAHPVKQPVPDAKPEPPPVFIDEQSTWDPPAAEDPPTLVVDGILQCVPYARFISGITLRGDAWTWWDQAAGLFARGNRPEPGAILSFAPTDRMPLGHIAVVTQVLTARKILVEHANWPNAVVQHGAISRDIQVLDVSDANDWSQVRVQFGEGGPMGSIYPINGFIYGWSETGVPVAQPRLKLDYALWAPVLPTLRNFAATSYTWALPPAERKKALAAAGAVAMKIQTAFTSGMPRRPGLMVNEASLGVTAIGRGADGRPIYQLDAR